VNLYYKFSDNVRILGIPLKFPRIKKMLKRLIVLIGAIVIKIGNKLTGQVLVGSRDKRTYRLILKGC